MQVRRSIREKSNVPSFVPPPKAVCAARSRGNARKETKRVRLGIVRGKAKATSSGITKERLMCHPKKGYVSKTAPAVSKARMSDNVEHPFKLYRQARDWAKQKLANRGSSFFRYNMFPFSIEISECLCF